jgi:hypothetical protein
MFSERVMIEDLRTTPQARGCEKSPRFEEILPLIVLLGDLGDPIRILVGDLSGGREDSWKKSDREVLYGVLDRYWSISLKNSMRRE